MYQHKPVVMWDIDGVLANFMEGFLRLAKQTYPSVELPSYPDGNHPTWNTAENLLSKEQVSHVWDKVKESAMFWRSLPVLPTEDERILMQKKSFTYDYIFITNRTGVDVKIQTEWWLKYHFRLSTPTVILSDQKGRVSSAVGAKIGIEDKLENAVDMSRWGVKPVLIFRPYNCLVTEEDKHIESVDNITTFLGRVDEFFSEKEAA